MRLAQLSTSVVQREVLLSLSYVNEALEKSEEWRELEQEFCG